MNFILLRQRDWFVSLAVTVELVVRCIKPCQHSPYSCHVTKGILFVQQGHL